MQVTTVDDRCRHFSIFFDDFKIFDFSEDRCTKSSFGKKTGLIFSNFTKKCLGPGASEKPFGPFGALREGPGDVLGGSWEILERPLRQSDFGSIF